jgi:hypothetical protein
MAVTATPALLQTPKNSKVQILPADTTTLKTLYTGGANGSKIVAVFASSTDTSTRDVQIGVTRSGTFFPLCTITVAITAGTVAGTSPASLLSSSAIPSLPVDNDGQTYILLSDSTDLLQVKALTTVTGAKEIDITAIGADF